VLIIQHIDLVPTHHKTVLEERNKAQDWITKILNTVRWFPPRN
jgi:hypothetical protein